MVLHCFEKVFWAYVSKLETTCWFWRLWKISYSLLIYCLVSKHRFSLFLWLSIVMDPSACNASSAKLRLKPVISLCRCEIEATLERLKKLERDLSFKEQELKERERRLKMWEQKLTEQSNTPVSAPCRVHRSRAQETGWAWQHGIPPPSPAASSPPASCLYTKGSTFILQ